MNRNVYVIESENGLVKIGIAKNPRVRTASISTQSGFKLKRTFFTEKCANARKIEHAAHSFFKENRVHGEWFKLDFEKAVQEVKRLFAEQAAPEEPENNNFGLCVLFYALHYSRDIIATSSYLCPQQPNGLLNLTVDAMKDWLLKGAPTALVPLSKETIHELLSTLGKEVDAKKALGYFGDIEEAVAYSKTGRPTDGNRA